jgi:trimeric autotransporter adhesin
MLRNASKTCSGIVVGMLLTLLLACGGGNGSQQSGVVLTKISITPSTISIPLGTTQQLSVVGTYSNDVTVNLTSQVAWSVTPSSVAKISSTGLLTTLATGAATVNATFTNINGHSGLSVQSPALTSIRLSPSTPAIPLGATQQMTATGTYTDGSTQNVTSTVAWSAAPAQNISVTGAGMARGLAQGSFSITASSGSITSSINGSVGNAVIQSLQVNPNSASIPKGTTESFTATALFSDGTTQNVTSTTTWGSTNASVASINSAGTATAGSQGSTQINASYQTFTGAAALTVSAATVTSIQVSPATASLAKGTSLQLAATATLTDGSTQNVTNSVAWSSSASSVCSVSATALVAAVAPGNCAATATSGAISGSASIVVTAATLKSITITPPNPSVNSGGSLQLTATGTFSDGSTQNVTALLTYASSNSAVASVNSSGLLQGLASGTATITASQGSVTTTVNVTITAAVLQSISLGTSTVTIAAGVSTQLTATGSYSDGSTQDLSATVSWMSSSPSVATVNVTGDVTGLGVGSSTVTATLGAISGSLNVSVTPATIVSISISPGSVTIAAGESQAFTATATLTDGSTLDVTTSVHWSVTNPLLATISNTLGTAGILSSLVAGSTTISASLDSITGTANLYVSAASLVSISVGPNGLSLALGVPATLTATGSFSDGSTQDITASAQWSSSNGQSASVSLGVVTPLSIGSANITASLNGVNGSVGVNITAAVLDSISISTINSLALGLTQQLSATGTYSDGSTQDITAVVHWSSSETGIATISAGGLVLAVGAGNASIAASLGSVTQTAPVTVSAAILESIAVTAPQDSFALGFTLQLSATGTYSDGSTQNLSASVSWASSNASIALINGTGLVSGILVGDISATASLQGVSGSLALTVNSATLVSITISPNPVSILGLLLSQQFTVTGHFSDGSTQTLSTGVLWSCSNALLGSINSSGLLTALGLGNLNAIATYDGLTATATVNIL